MKSLPTELIVFGKLRTAQQQQQLRSEFNTAPQSDFLSISINGLHRWSPQFESHIWKHLGEYEKTLITYCNVVRFAKVYWNRYHETKLTLIKVLIEALKLKYQTYSNNTHLCTNCLMHVHIIYKMLTQSYRLLSHILYGTQYAEPTQIQ